VLSQALLTAVCTAHLADYCVDGWWQIFRPANKSTYPDFEGEKLAKIFRLVCGNIRYMVMIVRQTVARQLYVAHYCILTGFDSFF